SLKVGVMTLLLLCWGAAESFAQQQVEISGQVTDASDGSSLPGVNIIVKGTTTGTTTNIDGEYNLRVPADADTLIFSFIGFLDQAIPLSDQTEINVALKPNVQSLQDVVVVGYGTQQKEQVTGSVSKVSSKEFVSGSISNPAQLIQGKVPGLSIATGGADPNSAPTIRLRGISSFGANQDPLVVIDGVKGGNLDNIDPNDIESISVLKDASASAIYGTRGSAGVIIVTTKSGIRGSQGVSVSYNGRFTTETAANKLDVLSADEYKSLSDQTGFTINDLGHRTNWFDEIAQRGYSNVHNLALSGGGESNSYRVSTNYRDRRGILITSRSKELNAHLNFSQWALDDRLKLDITVSVTDEKQDFGDPAAFRYAAIYNPTAPVRVDSFPTTGGFFEQPLFDYYNPVAILESSNRRTERTNLNGAVKATYEFEQLIPNLSASAFYSLQTSDVVYREFYARTNKRSGGATTNALGNGWAGQFSDDSRSELFETTLNYVADVNEFGLEAFVGYSYQNFTNQGYGAEGGDFITDQLGFNNLGLAQDFDQGEGTVSSYRNTHRLLGFFGRTNLSWDNTYFVNASLRREGSSRFGVSNKWGTFWSAGLGIDLTGIWDISSFDMLKFRGSYGVTGQDAPFSGISIQRFGPQGYFYVDGGYIQSFGPVSNANPDLKWEQKKGFNVGVDFEALDTRLTGSVEYYRSITDDLLFEVPVPVPPNLYPTTWKNVGQLNNQGIEASLGFLAIQQEDVSWNTRLTFSTFQPILKEYISDEIPYTAYAGSPGLDSINLIRIIVGEPIGHIWAREFACFSDDGKWFLYNAAGDKVTPDAITNEDKKVLGDGLPDFQLGWSNTFTYKSFDLDIFLRGVFGHDMVNTYKLFYQPPNQITSYNVLQSAFDITELTTSPQFSSFQVEDASFVRLQNATLGYNVPIAE